MRVQPKDAVRKRNAQMRQPHAGGQTEVGRSGHCALSQRPLRPASGRREDYARPQGRCTARARQRIDQRKQRMCTLMRAERVIQRVAACVGMMTNLHQRHSARDGGAQTEGSVEQRQPRVRSLVEGTADRLTAWGHNARFAGSVALASSTETRWASKRTCCAKIKTRKNNAT